MTLLVDTSVWSLALRRDGSASEPEVHQLKDALLGADVVVTTGLVLQELLQSFSGPQSSAQIIERFALLPLIQPDRDDYIAGAERETHAAAPAFKSERSTHSSRNYAFAMTSRF